MLRSTLGAGLVIAAAAGFCSCAYKYNNSAENAPTGSIVGTLVVNATRSSLSARRALAGAESVPLDGAVCTLEGTDRNAQSDASGKFMLAAVADGSYILICKRANSAGPAFAVLRVVEVKNGASVDLGMLLATQPGAIRGNATLPQQSDQTGIEVYIPGTQFSARTDATGAYLITDVPEGNYTLRFEHEGYLSMEVPDVNVESVQTTDVADIVLGLSTGASGSIVIADGKLYVDSRTVTVTITATEDATLMVLSEDVAFVGARC